MTFLLAMVLHPDILMRGQAEIDEVVGRSRLPNFNDQTSMPYVDAIVKESLRWRAGVPLGTSPI